ncbi:MAG: exosortase-associated EpsI family protein [Planctomycetes bacterium]|nr:exosortase-associated EpsI family protein [Planctomycetota bacterium]
MNPLRTPTTAAPTRLLTPHFAMAVAMLSVAAVLAGPVTRYMKIKQVKLPLPLKAPLEGFSAAALAPYRVVDKQVLDASIVEALGTEQYLSWLLENPSVPEQDPLRLASLLVTYYSGGKDMVPHTPDVCYFGAGYQPAQPHENLTLTLAGLPPGAERVPIRLLTFVKTAIHDHRKLSVVYTFHCNGRFAATRQDVRYLINDLRNTYAYFSKVEVSFPLATREQNVEGAGRLLERVLPELIRNHWPDFAAAESAVSAAP